MNAQKRAYHALRIAAERIGRNNYRSGLYRPLYRNGRLVRGYAITQEHRAVVEAMPKVLSGELDPDGAMALRHDSDVMKQRLGS
jgi:hypothetical protein